MASLPGPYWIVTVPTAASTVHGSPPSSSNDARPRPGSPRGPAGPCAPCGPVGPAGPATPGTPWSPCSPCGPRSPARPGCPRGTGRSGRTGAALRPTHVPNEAAFIGATGSTGRDEAHAAAGLGSAGRDRLRVGVAAARGCGKGPAADGGQQAEGYENADKRARTHGISLESRTGLAPEYPRPGALARARHGLGTELTQSRDGSPSRMDTCGPTAPSASSPPLSSRYSSWARWRSPSRPSPARGTSHRRRGS